MTNQEYIDNRLATYNEAFDFYMDCGEMPKSIEKGDILGAYLLTSSLKKHAFYNLLINNILYLCVT